MITCGGIHVVPRRVPDGEIICVCMLHAQCIAARVVVARTCCTNAVLSVGSISARLARDRHVTTSVVGSLLRWDHIK